MCIRDRAAGVPAEDARYLLPNAAETKIVITMNVRELLHFFSLRCCNRAQWEIREMEMCIRDRYNTTTKLRHSFYTMSIRR